MYSTPEPRRLSFTIPEMLGLTFRIYLENAVPLVILSTIIIVGFALFGALIGGATGLTAFSPVGNPTSAQVSAAFQSLVPLLILTLIAALVLAILQFVLTYGPITWLVSEYLLGNRGVGFQGMFRGASSRLASLAGGYFIFIVIAIITFLGVAVLSVVCPPAFLVMIPLIYLFMCIGFVLAPVIILERIDFAAALNRAWVLGKARFWVAVGLFFLLGLVIVILQVPQFIINWPTITQAFQSGATAAGRLQPPLVQSPLSLIVTTVTSILILPLAPIASTLFYYDTRTRTEGLDAALAALASPDARPQQLPSPLQGSGLTSQDFLNMLLLVGIGVIILLALAALSLSLVGLLQNTLPPGLFDRV